MRVESELSNAIVRLYKEHFGRGPTRASARLGPDAVVFELREALTATERLLVGAGHRPLVEETRTTLAELAAPALHSAVARLTGRPVQSSSTVLDTARDAVVVTVLLAPASVRARSGRPGGARRARARGASHGSAAIRARRA